MKKIVLALGGNALGKTPEEQLNLVKSTASSLVDLILQGHQLVISHGNGPQVGMINLGMSYAAEYQQAPQIPFPECGAMSQGYIGYHLQQSLQNELKARNFAKEVVSIVTQVLVDQKDTAFLNPTKPVGSFYTKEQAEQMADEKGYTFVEDAGRGYRQVVASPTPLEIIELECIQDLVENNRLVIAVGGGGIPVISTEQGLIGVPAVIDKDRSSALLAEKLAADELIILTAIDHVCIHYGKENQKELKTLDVKQAQKYIEQGEFAPGSMLPKIEACLEFVQSGENKRALITSLENLTKALKGEVGTVIKK